jgi:hypothetical protein
MAAPANVTNVAASASSVQLFADDPQYSGFEQRIVVNDSTATLYVKFGTGASATSHTYPLAPGAVLEFNRPVYPGVVEGIWTAATGAARVTEVPA